MNHITPRAAIWVWLFLVVATLGVAWLAEGSAHISATTLVLLLLIAAVKTHLLILYFMEIKWAPIEWKITFGLWVWVVFALILTLWALL